MSPFIICKHISKVAYALQLPLKIKIHNVFHFNFLKPYIPLMDPLLILKCPGPAFCLFLKFGQAIVVRVLMLNF